MIVGVAVLPLVPHQAGLSGLLEPSLQIVLGPASHALQIVKNKHLAQHTGLSKDRLGFRRESGEALSDDRSYALGYQDLVDCVCRPTVFGVVHISVFDQALDNLNYEERVAFRSTIH